MRGDESGAPGNDRSGDERDRFRRWKWVQCDHLATAANFIENNMATQCQEFVALIFTGRAEGRLVSLQNASTRTKNPSYNNPDKLKKAWTYPKLVLLITVIIGLIATLKWVKKRQQ